MHACMRVEGAGGQRPQRTVVRGAPGRRYDPCVARGVGRRCGSRRVGRSDLRACRLGRGTGRRAVPRWRRASADRAGQDDNLDDLLRAVRAARIAAWAPWDGRHGMSVPEQSPYRATHEQTGAIQLLTLWTPLPALDPPPFRLRARRHKNGTSSTPASRRHGSWARARIHAHGTRT